MFSESKEQKKNPKLRTKIKNLKFIRRISLYQSQKFKKDTKRSGITMAGVGGKKATGAELYRLDSNDDFFGPNATFQSENPDGKNQQKVQPVSLTGETDRCGINIWHVRDRNH
jgi:hypothetical protein